MLDMECRKVLAGLLAKVSADEDFRIAPDGCFIQYIDTVSEQWTELNDMRALEKLWGEVMALNHKINSALRFMNYTAMTPITRMYEVWLETGITVDDQAFKLSAKVRRVLAELLGNLKDGNGYTNAGTTIIDLENETICWSDGEALEVLFEELDRIFKWQRMLMGFVVEWHLFADLMKQARKIPKFSITW